MINCLKENKRIIRKETKKNLNRVRWRWKIKLIRSKKWEKRAKIRENWKQLKRVKLIDYKEKPEEE